MEREMKNTHIILMAKYAPCSCHTCFEVICANCKCKCFQTTEKLKLHKDGARNFCPGCCGLLKKQLGEENVFNVNIP